MLKSFITAILSSFLLLTALTASAESLDASDLQILDPWARGSAGRTETAAAFLRIRNISDHADRLVAARTGIAEAAELHTHLHEDGVMRMRQVEYIDLPADETIELAPGGDHVMLFQLKTPLQEGQSFPLSLTFEKAGTLEVEVKVYPVGSAGPGED